MGWTLRADAARTWFGDVIINIGSGVRVAGLDPLTDSSIFCLFILHEQPQFGFYGETYPGVNLPPWEHSQF